MPEPIHPGVHLAEILTESGITQYRLAKTIGVPQIRIHDIVHCRRAITADTALRIGKALGMTPDFWLNLQRRCDLDVARAKVDVIAASNRWWSLPNGSVVGSGKKRFYPAKP